MLLGNGGGGGGGDARSYSASSSFCENNLLRLKSAASTSLSSVNNNNNNDDDDDKNIRPPVMFNNNNNNNNNSKNTSSNNAPPVVTGVTLKLAFDSSPECWGIADLSVTKSDRFTSSASLDMVHRLRAVSDCVVVGRATVVVDNCTLTVRRPDGQRLLRETAKPQPTRVIIDPSLALLHACCDSPQQQYAMFDDGIAPVIIYHGIPPHELSVQIFEFLAAHPAIQITYLPPSLPSTNRDTVTTHTHIAPPNRKLSAKDIVHDLHHSQGMQHIMVEGGAQTARLFLQEQQVNRAIIVRAPIQFQTPLPSYIDETVLAAAGLLQVGSVGSDDNDGGSGKNDKDSNATDTNTDTKFEGDTVDYWVKKEVRNDDGDIDNDNDDPRWVVNYLSDWP